MFRIHYNYKKRVTTFASAQSYNNGMDCNLEISTRTSYFYYFMSNNWNEFWRPSMNNDKLKCCMLNHIDVLLI